MGEYVCNNCVKEPDIQAFIRENAEFNNCDYCNRVSKENLISVDIEELADFIVEGFSTELEDPAEHIPFESREGGYQTPLKSTYDLLIEEAGVEIDALLVDLVQIIDLQYWADKNWTSIPESDQLFYSWEYFCDIVKYTARYIFYRLKWKQEDSDVIWFYEILDQIAEMVSELDLFKSINIGTEYYRVRISDTKFEEVYDLAPPHRDKALISNRMSATGIPIFYGSTDCDTALAEVYNKEKTNNKFASIGRFKTIKDLTVLDLSNLPPIPSMFDKDQSIFRHTLIFLHRFVADVMKPIKKDEKFHVDYVPTQVFAETIHFLIPFNSKFRLDGILYPSSRSTTGVNVALFITNDHCIDERKQSRLRIIMDIPNPVLSLIEANSIRVNTGVLTKALKILRRVWGNT